MAKGIRIRLKKSTIGASQKQKDAIRCLGLRKIRHERVVPDNPAMRGTIFKVQHFLDVEMEK